MMGERTEFFTWPFVLCMKHYWGRPVLLNDWGGKTCRLSRIGVVGQ